MAATLPRDRPRVGLVLKKLAGSGGMEISSMRHARLLSDRIDVLPISLESSADERDWCGRVEEVALPSGRGYRIMSGRLTVDRVRDEKDFLYQSYTHQLVRIARKERLDALHVYGAFRLRPFVSAMAAVQCDIPLIISFRGADLDLRIFGKDFSHLQAALQVASACVCVNAASRKILQSLLRRDCPLSVIHNHVDPGDFPQGEPVGLPFPGPIIASVGEFRRITGLDFLLHAFDEMAARRACSLVLIGPTRPDEATYYSPLIDGLRHSARVHRIGGVEHSQILSYLQACDVLAFPSISDGSPNKVLEAMLAGRAIAASRAAGITELIRDGTDGILFDPFEQGQLTAALEALLDDPARRRRYGESARQRALSSFTPEHERAAWLECYSGAGLCL